MKLRKLLAGAAALAVTAASMTAVAGAELIEIADIKDENGLLLFDSSSSSWMPIGYSNGERDTSQKAVVDYGVDWSKAASIEVVFIVDDQDSNYSRDDWDGGFGGAVILSSQADGNVTHNWNAKDFWGVVDEDLELDTADPNKSFVLEKIGDYTYKGVCPIDDDNYVVDNAQLVQICVADWSGVTWWAMRVDSMKVLDASGNMLIGWDSTGNVIGDTAVTAAPAEEAPVEEAPAAPAEEAPAPAAGDVAAATDSSKGSPDTGVADVAVVAGLGIAAAGALVVAKKRK